MTISTEKYYAFDAVEWITQNMHRNYPIVDDCITSSIAGIYFPSSFIADISLHILPGIVSKSNFYISSVVNVGGYITVSISYHTTDGSDDFVCARVTGISAGLQAGDTIASRTFTVLAATDTIPDEYKDLRVMSGTLIIGACSDIGNNSFILTYDTARLLDTCVSQSLAGISSISVIDSTENTTMFSSDFSVQAGDGIDFEIRNELNSDTGLYEQTLVVYRVATDAEKSATYQTVAQVVNAVLDELGDPIKTINGVSPDTYGNIEVTGDDCTEVSTGTASISISNKCAKPCCSETSPADVNTALQSLEDVKERLLAYFTTLSTNVNTMQARLASLIAADNN